MIIWGKIREFPLFSILQFLAAQRKTGVLEIQDYEEYGVIYMSNGRVDAITLPLSDELLGARLVAVGAITEKRVKDCMINYVEEEGASPLAAALLGLAEAERETLREIVTKHTSDQMMQLMYWNSGTFKFSASGEAARFPVTPAEDLENMLLEAYRRVDEGERPRREKVVLDEEFCLTCTIECSDAIKARFLKPDICLWRSMPSVLKESVFRSVRLPIADEDRDDSLFL